MRRTREEAAKSRRGITAKAAQLFRTKGIGGVGVADVMAAAGLTHGGFYRHFASKEALAAEAVTEACAARLTRLEGDTPQARAAALAAYVAAYLSAAHVAAPGEGCPIAALGAEAGRSGPPLTTAFAEGIAALVARIEAALPDPDGRAAALRLLAGLVGAVVIARAVGDDPLAAEVLAALRAPDCTGSAPSELHDEGAATG